MNRPAADTTRLPPRWLPVLYLAFAHAALAAAFAAVVMNAVSVTAFFYHPRMFAIVHLVTLGWITGSILGALYLVAPIALRTNLPAGRLDAAAAVCYAIGVVGVVSHFWIAEYNGLAWSGGLIVAAVLTVGARAARPLWRAPIAGAVRAHIALAFVNFAAAATAGMLIAGEKVTHPVLPGSLLAQVYAHAHAAAVGWAAMMVVGVAYRLLPMVLPARMPAGRTLYVTAVLLQIGVTGLFVTLLAGRDGAWIWAACLIAGFASFALHAVWMLRHRLPRPPAIRTPDPALLHAATSGLALAIACVLGAVLAVAVPTEVTLRIASAYGALGLVGFLAQMVVAMEGRLLTLHAWYWAFANRGYRHPGFSPHDIASRPAQLTIWVLWVLGIASLAIGLGLGRVALVRGGGCVLFAATVLDSAHLGHVIRRAAR